MKTYYVKWVDAKSNKLRIALTSAVDMAEVRSRIKSDLKQDLPDDIFILELPSESNPSFVYYETRKIGE